MCLLIIENEYVALLSPDYILFVEYKLIIVVVWLTAYLIRMIG